MKSIAAVILWTLLFLFLAACAGHIETVQKELQRQNSPFVGQHKDEILKNKGAPDLKAQLSTGEDVWTYRSTKTGQHKGWTATVSTGDRESDPQPSLVSWTETVTFIIGADGVVKDVSVDVQ